VKKDIKQKSKKVKGRKKKREGQRDGERERRKGSPIKNKNISFLKQLKLQLTLGNS
jgi:hypothetical protein